MGLGKDRDVKAGVERRAHAAGGTQRATEGLGQCGQGLIARVYGGWRLGARVYGTELAANAVELHADHLPMANTAGEHVEQDAAIEHPGNQRAVGTGEFHGAALYHQTTKCLQKI